MKILVLGGSGGVGRHVLRLARDAGHSVTVIVRAALDDAAGIDVIVDDVCRDGVFVGRVEGHDVVLSSLGLKRKNPANPWSALVSPPDFNSRTARALIAAMKDEGVARVVAVSAAGVGDSAPQMNGLMKLLVARSNVGVAYRDLDVMEQLFAASGLDWCCPRPTRLTDGPLTRQVKVIEGFPMTAAISRADVAAWMLANALPSAGPSSSRTPTISA